VSRLAHLSIDSLLIQTLNTLIFPNPTYNSLFIKINRPSLEAWVEVCHLKGRRELSMEVCKLKKTQVDFDQFEASVYFMKFTQVDGFQLFRIIKQ